MTEKGRVEVTKVEQIQAEIDNKNAAIEQEAANGQQTNHEQIIQWRNEINLLQMQLSDAKAEEAQQSERVQAQTEKVESITLPYDYNEIFDNPTANDNIKAVVKQFHRQAYDEHNTEVTRIHTEWNQKMVDLSNLAKDTNDKLKLENQSLHEDIQSLTNDLEGEKSMYGELEANYAHIQTLLNQANMDKADAELKRDNAIKHMAEMTNAGVLLENENADLKAQIEALQQELTAKKALTVNGNDKLAELASKAKESTIEKANRGLQRWGLPTIEVPSMPAAEIPTLENQFLADPPIPVAQEEHPKDEVQDGNTEGNSAMEGNAAIPQSLGERTASAEETTVITLESLKAEIDALKTAHDSTALTVARIAEKANLPIAV